MANISGEKEKLDNQEMFLAIDFLGVFFSMLKKANKNVVSSKQLFDTVGKYCNNFMDLFMDIDVRDNCGAYYSKDLEEGITMLQILGAVSKANPRYEKIILKIDKDSADEMINDCNNEKRIRIEEFVNIFLKENYS